MPSATRITKKPTMSQPQVTATGAAVVERDEVRRQATGEDRDDRERDGEVREAAHLAVEHLRVAELVERVLVVVVPLNPWCVGAHLPSLMVWNRR
jgi:hypothetical protein